MSLCLDVTLPPEVYAAKPLLTVVAGLLLDSDGRMLLTSRPPGKVLPDSGNSLVAKSASTNR